MKSISLLRNLSEVTLTFWRNVENRNVESASRS
jgi:hypothetical protein